MAIHKNKIVMQLQNCQNQDIQDYKIYRIISVKLLDKLLKS